MKNIHKLTMMAAIAMIAMFALCLPALAQVIPTDYGNITVTNSLANATTYTVASNRLEVVNGKGLTVIPFLTGDTNTTNDVTLNFQASADGTNYTTSASDLALNVILAASTAANSKLFVIPYSKLEGVRFLKLTTITTTVTNAVGITRIQYSRFR